MRYFLDYLFMKLSTLIILQEEEEIIIHFNVSHWNPIFIKVILKITYRVKIVTNSKSTKIKHQVLFYSSDVCI